jgi:small subunit ribosomal protein S20
VTQGEKLRRLTASHPPLLYRPFSEENKVMANTKSAAKRARQTTRRTTTNRRALTGVKNQLRNLREVLKGTDKAKAKSAAAQFISAIDKAVKTGRVHSNTANRHKSAVNRALAKLA